MSGEAARQKALFRILTLMEWTAANGCTEGEVAAAAAKVNELMAAHKILPDEIGAWKQAPEEHPLGTPPPRPSPFEVQR